MFEPRYRQKSRFLTLPRARSSQATPFTLANRAAMSSRLDEAERVNTGNK